MVLGPVVISISTEEVKRIVPGAEMFIGESVMQYIADLSDEAHYEDRETFGYLLGRMYHDDRGKYVVVSGVTQKGGVSSETVGVFRTSLEGGEICPDDVRRAHSLFGGTRSYLIIVDTHMSQMAMFSIDNGVAMKVPSAMIENL